MTESGLPPVNMRNCVNFRIGVFFLFIFVSYLPCVIQTFIFLVFINSRKVTELTVSYCKRREKRHTFDLPLNFDQPVISS